MRIGTPGMATMSWDGRENPATPGLLFTEQRTSQPIEQHCRLPKGGVVLLAVKLSIDCGDANIGIFRLDLKGGQSVTEMPDASPILTTAFTPPDDWDATDIGTQVRGILVRNAWAWRGASPIVGRSLVTIHKPLFPFDIRQISAGDDMHFLARWFRSRARHAMECDAHPLVCARARLGTRGRWRGCLFDCLNPRSLGWTTCGR